MTQTVHTGLDVSFHQGTWKFMAADLVESPDIQQTLEHDLESFFWVLFWIILTQVPCSWNIAIRSKFIEDTINPKVYGQSGGRAKKTFLTNPFKLLKTDFDIPHNERLHNLLKTMKKLVAARHHPSPRKPENYDYNPITDDPDTEMTPDQIAEDYKKQYAWYDRRLTFLKDHGKMRRTFEVALFGPSDSEWPSGDAAIFQGILASRSTIWLGNSGSKRSRTVAEENDIFTEPSSSKRRRC
jgi:hypothetical protein